MLSPVYLLHKTNASGPSPLLFIGPILPALTVLFLALNTSYLPDNDYWGIITALISRGEISLSLQDLLLRSNEHIVAVPKLIYVLNYKITAGSNTGLAIITWMIATMQLIFLIKLLPTEVIKQNTLAFFSSLVFPYSH